AGSDGGVPQCGRVNVFGIPIPAFFIFLERIEGGVGKDVVLRGPDASDERGVARVGERGDDPRPAFGGGAFFQEAAEVGNFGAVGVGGGDVVGAHAVDGNHDQEWRGVLGGGEAGRGQDQ